MKRMWKKNVSFEVNKMAWNVYGTSNNRNVIYQRSLTFHYWVLCKRVFATDSQEFSIKVTDNL